MSAADIWGSFFNKPELTEPPPLASASSPDDGVVDGAALYGDKVKVDHLVSPGTEAWHKDAVDAIRSVFDPEIPLNVYDLGLIYRVETLPGGVARIEMTLTSPACPEAEALPGRVEASLMGLDQTMEVQLELVWDPAWGPDRMSEEARLELGFY